MTEKFPDDLPLDDNRNGTFDADLRMQGRVAALDSAARSMAGTKQATDPHEVLAQAEVFEAWLLRPPSF